MELKDVCCCGRLTGSSESPRRSECSTHRAERHEIGWRLLGVRLPPSKLERSDRSAALQPPEIVEQSVTPSAAVIGQGSRADTK